jgi:hypothetical protein
MSLAPGTRLGPYEIVAAIGAGGMGEVYRAKDTRLGRDVAVKVLSEGFTGDPDRRARFEREAKAVAALSHPNILAIFDVGTHDGQMYAVTELLEGQSLRDRLSAGALPVRKAVEVTVQIARGLAAAHDRGIVHRDLKPENVFVLTGGQVKILDFGLARQIPTGTGSTETGLVATDPGTVMGTVGYMAPEQVRGEVTDARTDLFALGAVLYEALTGKRAFKRATAAETMTAILNDDPPDLSTTRTDLPAVLDRIVRHCLEKHPAERFQTALDVAFALDALSGGSTTSQPSIPASAPGSAAAVGRKPVLAWSLAAAALLVAAGAVWWAWRTPAPEVWTGVALGGPSQAFCVRLSPDGQLLAFLAMVDQTSQVAIMKPDGTSWAVITRESGHGYVASVAWAPDGSKMYFDRMGGHPLGVYSVPPLGGEPRLVLDAAFGPQALPDGSLIVLKLTDHGDEQLFHYWPDSGRLEPLPVFMRQTDVAPMLRAFPDGKELVFYGMSEAGRSEVPRILMYTLATRTTRDLESKRRRSLKDWSPLDVSPDGQSVYFLSDEGDTRLLVQVPRTSGQPRVLLTFASSSSPVSVSAARDGSLYLDQLLRPETMVRSSPSGAAVEEFGVPLTETPGVVAPDGEVLLSQPTGGKRQLTGMRLGGAPRLLVNTADETSFPATIFGDHVAFHVGSGDAKRIAIASLGDGRVVRRYRSRSDAGLSASPDGKTLYYSFGGGIWAQPVDGGEPARIADGEDVAVDPTGQHLYVKRSRNGAVTMVRLSVRGTDAEELPMPPGYQLGFPPLSPAAVDSHGRVLVTVLSQSQSFYYKVAVLDPATKSFTLIPIAIEGDVAAAGWTADGHVLADADRYLLTLWRYQRTASVK